MALSWLVPSKGPTNGILKFCAWRPEIATGRDNGITDVPIQFAGLVYSWPVSSSPLHAPRSGAHWPNGMEQLPPFHWRQTILAVQQTACLFHSLFTAFLSNDNFSHSCGNGSATFILFNGTESVKIWLSTMHTHNVLFCEQLTHISIVFQSYQHVTVIWHKLSKYTPCVTALILSECTNSPCEATQTALSHTAPNIVNLDPLLPTLCTDSSSLRGGKQHNFYCTNSSEQNSSKQR